MASRSIILLLSALVRIASAQVTFYGESVHFLPLQKNKDGTFQVSFYYRENGKSSCANQLSYSCVEDVCTSFDKTAAVETDKDASGQDRWCQSQGHGSATIPADKSSFSLSASTKDGTWTASSEVDLGTRSDTNTFNHCPVTATVATLRAPQNCFSILHLLAHDPDGDHVRCRFSGNATVDANVELDENECTVKTKGQLGVGLHVFDLVLEDFSTKSVTLSYADGTSVVREPFNSSSSSNNPFCQVALQFTLEILPTVPLLGCVAGHSLPQFLSQTPSYGDVHHATVGVKLNLYAQAQANHAKIYDFQLSGPQDMTKDFKDGTFGKADVTLSWTPQLKDLHRVIPVCFTAEARESQSEMRCVIVTVTKSSDIKGNAKVMCSANRMTVALEKASMPDLNKSWLKLLDPTCTLASNATHIFSTISFSACGTKIEDKGDFILFKNEIQSEQPTGVITRRRGVNIGFSCQFPKTISISSNYELKKSDYVFTESSFGSFGYSFEIFSDNKFTSKIPASEYPVEVKLLDMIYMGIQAESNLPDVTLFVESCKATPDDNPDNSLFYNLISNGCKTDETLIVHPSDPKSFRFEIQAFKFSGKFDQVYITCSVILCETGSPFSRCAQGCLSSPARRRRSLSMETASHYISQGPLRFVGQPVLNAAVDELPMPREAVQPRVADKPTPREADQPVAVKSTAYPPARKAAGSQQGGWSIFLSLNISTVVLGGLFTVSTVLLAVVIGHFARKTRAGDKAFLVES